MWGQNTIPELIGVGKKEMSCCKICNKLIKDIRKEQLDWIGKNSGKYKIWQRIERHLKENHNISIELYLEKYFNIKTPKCKCGCGQKVKVRAGLSPMRWNCFSCGRNGGWSDIAKNNRSGSGNPNFGKVSKIKNKTKDDCEICKKISESNKKPKSQQHKINVSKGLKNGYQTGKIKKYYGEDHWNYNSIISDETKNKITDSKIKNIKLGKNKVSKLHLFFIDILLSLNINFEEEKRVNYYLVDFYLTDYDIYIEVDGDYWHCNPKKYKDGPINDSQKRVKDRDIIKNNYFHENNLKLIRFWEYDIYNNTNEIIEKIKCVTNKL
jgi:very-short-patch-repair endonuclease